VRATRWRRPASPDAEFYKTLAKALEEIAAGMERLAKPE